MGQRITLIRGSDVWLARHSDPTVRELFGTDTLPTVFDRQVSPIVVQHKIQRLNPDAEVGVEA